MRKIPEIALSRTVIALAPMVMGLALAMDIYIPAVPHIADIFHASAGKMQLTLTLFMLIAGLMQLIVGPLADQFGRKILSFVAITIFALGTLLCSSAHSIYELVSYRIIQAIGSAGMLVVSFAIVRDLYHGGKSAQAYSYLNGVISFSPMFAPFIGSYLDIRFGWPSTFLALLITAALAWIALSILLPESLPTNRRQKITVHIFQGYRDIFSNQLFFYYTLAAAMGLSYLYLFCSISPYVIIRLLHIPESHYGFYFAFMGVSFFIGSFLSGFTVAKIGIYHTVVLGFFITLIGGIIMTIWYVITGLTINNFIWPMLLIGIGGTFCMGAGTGGAMEPFGETAGAASALGGATRFAFSAIVGSVVITSKVSSTLPLAIPAVLFSLLGISLFLPLHKRLAICQ